jgi:hypothetical protein
MFNLYPLQNSYEIMPVVTTRLIVGLNIVQIKRHLKLKT